MKSTPMALWFAALLAAPTFSAMACIEPPDDDPVSPPPPRPPELWSEWDERTGRTRIGIEVGISPPSVGGVNCACGIQFSATPGGLPVIPPNFKLWDASVEAGYKDLNGRWVTLHTYPFEFEVSSMLTPQDPPPANGFLPNFFYAEALNVPDPSDPRWNPSLTVPPGGNLVIKMWFEVSGDAWLGYAQFIAGSSNDPSHPASQPFTSLNGGEVLICPESSFGWSLALPAGAVLGFMEWRRRARRSA